MAVFNTIVKGSSAKSYIPLNVEDGVLKKGLPVLPENAVLGEYSFFHEYEKYSGTVENLDLSKVITIKNSALYCAFQNAGTFNHVDLSNVASVEDSGCLNTFYRSNIGELDFSGLTTLSSDDEQQFDGMCSNSSITDVYFNSLTTVPSSRAFYSAFQNCTSLKTINFDSLTTVSGSNSFCNTFYRCIELEEASFPSLTTIRHNDSESSDNTGIFKYAFQNCISLESVSFPVLTEITGKSAFYQTFSGCTSLKNVDLGALATISANNSGAETFKETFKNCAALERVDLSSCTGGAYLFYNTFSGALNDDTVILLNPNICCMHKMFEYSNIKDASFMAQMTEVSKYYHLNSTFDGCTHLEELDLSNLKTISGADSCKRFTLGCSNLQSVDLSSLYSMDGDGNSLDFSNLSSLTTVRLDSLNAILHSGNSLKFSSCPLLTDLKFPNFAPDSSIATDCFTSLCLNVTGRTLHFPANLDPATGGTLIPSLTNYPNFGGTNTVILYDLPSTFTLTGSDGKKYKRNPKFDTANALAWYPVGYDRFDVANIRTTTGTADPVVGGRIYNADGTETVTIISSIA